ncbi:MAG: thioester domain-containing protein [Mycobacterium sp.]
MSLITASTPTRVPVSVSRREQSDHDHDARLTRYRPGTFSSTVETVVFADGTIARTDLIRLNPNAQAYSLDFSATAPTRPAPYRPSAWSAVSNPAARDHESEVGWILRNSFPTVSTAELSTRLRAAGMSTDQANLAEHEAIAATQAAIWFFTNGLELDNRPLHVPARTAVQSGSITFEFDGAPQLGGYHVAVSSGAKATVSLQKSTDGLVWRDVAGSALEVRGAGLYRKTLGVGATTSHTQSGGVGVGYRFYRMVGAADLGEVTFWLQGTGHYRNPERIVRLYDYLVAGARWARRRSSAPELNAADATVLGDHVGPFRLHADQAAQLTADRALVVDADGSRLHAVEPGGLFWLQPHLGADAVTLTATVEGDRVVTGVAVNEADRGLTPVALTRAVPVRVEFQLRWRNALRTDAFGDDRRMWA